MQPTSQQCQHVEEINSVVVVMVVLAATFIMIRTQLTQDHTQGTSLTKHQTQLTQDHTQGTSLTKHQTQLIQDHTTITHSKHTIHQIQ